MITTLLAFLVTLGVLIVVHEYGHYKVARWCGVKVLRFSVGFGKPIWRRQAAGGTEFVVAALPLGGYVKMLDEREGPVAPSELPYAFTRQSLSRRAAIVAAGPIANLLLAVLLYAGVHWIGMEEPKPVLSAPIPGSLAERADLRSGDWVRAVSDDGGQTWRDVRTARELSWEVTKAALDSRLLLMQVSDRSGRAAREVQLELIRQRTSTMDEAATRTIGLGAVYREPIITKVDPGSAADEAGVKPGDRVVRIDGRPIPDAEVMLRTIRASGGQAQTWVIEGKGGTLADVVVKPRLVTERGETFGRVGVTRGAPAEMVFVREDLVDGVVRGVARTWDMASMTVRLLGRMFTDLSSVKNLSGPLSIADAAGQTARLGVIPFLEFLAVVSVGLGVLNLLPIPVLDGGHLMYYLFEAVTRRPLSDAWLQRLQRGGVFVLLLLMTVAITNDVIRHVIQRLGS